MRYRTGFTIVELTIVIVIIGFIVMGILIGQDLIWSARLKSDIRTMKELDTTINSFEVKYNCIPGDCPNVVSKLGDSGPTIYNGDGNGSIFPSSGMLEYLILSTGEHSEFADFYAHLAAAGMVRLSPFDAQVTSGHKDNALKTRTKGYFLVGADNVGISQIYHHYGAEIEDNGAIYRNPVNTNQEAYFFDRKLDDGKPNNGIVKSRFFPIGGMLYLGDHDDPGNLGCATGGEVNAEYTLSSSERACIVRVRISR